MYPHTSILPSERASPQYATWLKDGLEDKWRNNFDKIFQVITLKRCAPMIKFDTGDMLVMADISQLFRDALQHEDMLGMVPSDLDPTYNNGGLLVVGKNRLKAGQLPDDLRAVAASTQINREQGLLQAYLRGAGRAFFRRLPKKYNVEWHYWLVAQRGSRRKQPLLRSHDAAIVHFVGAKPWQWAVPPSKWHTYWWQEHARHRLLVHCQHSTEAHVANWIVLQYKLQASLVPGNLGQTLSDVRACATDVPLVNSTQRRWSNQPRPPRAPTPVVPSPLARPRPPVVPLPPASRAPARIAAHVWRFAARDPSASADGAISDGFATAALRAAFADGAEIARQPATVDIGRALDGPTAVVAALVAARTRYRTASALEGAVAAAAVCTAARDAAARALLARAAAGAPAVRLDARDEELALAAHDIARAAIGPQGASAAAYALGALGDAPPCLISGGRAAALHGDVHGCAEALRHRSVHELPPELLSAYYLAVLSRLVGARCCAALVRAGDGARGSSVAFVPPIELARTGTAAEPLLVVLARCPAGAGGLFVEGEGGVVYNSPVVNSLVHIPLVPVYADADAAAEPAVAVAPRETQPAGGVARRADASAACAAVAAERIAGLVPWLPGALAVLASRLHAPPTSAATDEAEGARRELTALAATLRAAVRTRALAARPPPAHGAGAAGAAAPVGNDCLLAAVLAALPAAAARRASARRARAAAAARRRHGGARGGRAEPVGHATLWAWERDRAADGRPMGAAPRQFARGDAVLVGAARTRRARASAADAPAAAAAAPAPAADDRRVLLDAAVQRASQASSELAANVSGGEGLVALEAACCAARSGGGGAAAATRRAAHATPALAASAVQAPKSGGAVATAAAQRAPAGAARAAHTSAARSSRQPTARTTVERPAARVLADARRAPRRRRRRASAPEPAAVVARAAAAAFASGVRVVARVAATLRAQQLAAHALAAAQLPTAQAAAHAAPGGAGPIVHAQRREQAIPVTSQQARLATPGDVQAVLVASKVRTPLPGRRPDGLARSAEPPSNRSPSAHNATSAFLEHVLGPDVFKVVVIQTCAVINSGGSTAVAPRPGGPRALKRERPLAHGTGKAVREAGACAKAVRESLDSGATDAERLVSIYRGAGSAGANAFAPLYVSLTAAWRAARTPELIPTLLDFARRIGLDAHAPEAAQLCARTGVLHLEWLFGRRRDVEALARGALSAVSHSSPRCSTPRARQATGLLAGADPKRDLVPLALWLTEMLRADATLRPLFSAPPNEHGDSRRELDAQSRQEEETFRQMMRAPNTLADRYLKGQCGSLPLHAAQQAQRAAAPPDTRGDAEYAAELHAQYTAEDERDRTAKGMADKAREDARTREADQSGPTALQPAPNSPASPPGRIRFSPLADDGVDERLAKLHHADAARRARQLPGNQPAQPPRQRARGPRRTWRHGAQPPRVAGLEDASDRAAGGTRPSRTTTRAAAAAGAAGCAVALVAAARAASAAGSDASWVATGGGLHGGARRRGGRVLAVRAAGGHRDRAAGARARGSAARCAVVAGLAAGAAICAVLLVAAVNAAVCAAPMGTVCAAAACATAGSAAALPLVGARAARSAPASVGGALRGGLLPRLRVDDGPGARGCGLRGGELRGGERVGGERLGAQRGGDARDRARARSQRRGGGARDGCCRLGGSGGGGGGGGAARGARRRGRARRAARRWPARWAACRSPSRS
ncbi:hypothetical protein KFE25_011734 [Diacronema lutheri]|uniref:Uncharacterized protein n=1 Tax=Diacronema lutheri TaxID=2081491 RepID=A0A8J5XCR4_DIALT|nr:hypothetical protein KFE25_011734 [Diacronema lutheri]